MKNSTNENYKLLYLHKYGRKAASYRYRFELFFPKMKAKGFQIQSQSLLEDQYLHQLYTTGQRPWVQVLLGLLKRVLFLILGPRHDLKIVYMELFPGLPYFLERIFLKPNSYILELDDAFFLNYENGLLKKKIPSLMKNARAVIAGSHYLQSYALKYNLNTVLIPTVINLENYKKRKTHTDAPVTIGWIGSPSTSVELQNFKKVFKKLEKYNSKIKFLFIGSPKQELDIQNVEFREWNEDNQIHDIYEMDIGIMPLENTHWNKGKCGFKLIQYMAAGIPVVTSPVGENSIIVADGESGYCPSTEDQWFEALRLMIFFKLGFMW